LTLEVRQNPLWLIDSLSVLSSAEVSNHGNSLACFTTKPCVNPVVPQVSASSDRFRIDNPVRSIIAMSFQLRRCRQGIHHGNLILRFQNTSSDGFLMISC